MERKQKIMMISVICVVICVILAVILVMVIPKPEKQEDPKPWWEQRDKLEFVLEDERSIEKTYSYKPGDNTADMVFNYIDDKNDPTECIPRIKVYYGGIEKQVDLILQSRVRYNENQKQYNSVALIQGLGKYNVSFYLFPINIDCNNLKNLITEIVIEININKGLKG